MRSLLALPIPLLFALPAFADTDKDRLNEIGRFFENAQVINGPTVVDCTLSGGTETTCFSITVKPEPTTYIPGPWCPTSINDAADKGGIWLKDGEALDVDGSFITNLSTLYEDDEWQLFDAETGDVRVTDTLVKCEAAARPDVDPEYNNYCVQCLPEYMPDDASVTYVIPLKPQDSARTSPTNMSGAGVAVNGVRLDGPAPVDAILAAHTVAPFDDCGGHVNTHVGYHYHAVTDCLDGPAADASDAAQIGIAMDGYAIFSHLLFDGTEPDDLDECNGHETDLTGFHYHAGAPGTNAILGCLRAETGCVSETPDGTCNAASTARPPRP
jgi:hypothetical protein